MKQNFYSTLGTDYAKDKQLIKKIMSNPNVFVGWVDSYDAETCSACIQPAMQRENVDENSVADYINRPYLNNVYIVSNTLPRNPQKGDKALVLVLDEKSNAFFKAQYDSAKSLQDQTFVNTSKSVKTLSNCVAIIINGDTVQQTYSHNIVCQRYNTDGFLFTITLTTTDSTPFTARTLQDYLREKLGINSTKQVQITGFSIDGNGVCTGSLVNQISGEFSGLEISGFNMTTFARFSQIVNLATDAYIRDTVL